MLAIAQRSLFAARHASVRALSTSAVARKDLVQDIYLKELKSFEAPKAAPDAHKGVVREFSEPRAPQAPSVNTSEITSQLDAFQSAEPDEVPAAARADEHASETQSIHQYLEELRADKQVDAHH